MTRKWLIAIPAILLQFFIFKHFYPYASFFQDSYSYIYAAMEHDVIGYRPIGYSWFLRLIHAISASDTFLVFIQYCLLQGAGLYLYFSVVRLFSPRKSIQHLLFFFLLFDPLLLYLANVVSSDALFIALSLIWLTTLLWLVRRPSVRHLLLQLFLLILIFYTRYNALCYPVIAAAAVLLTRKGAVFKLTGIVSSVLVLVFGVLIVREATRQQTGVKIFSAFSAWQIANNALFMYPYIQVDPSRLPSAECRELDSFVRATPAHQPVDTWYMWDPQSPLKKYMQMRQKKEHTGYFTAWNKVAPVYSEYGYYLTTRHPWLFTREYLWPSARIFFYPDLEMLMRYNEGESKVDQTAKDWFHYGSTQVRIACSPDLQGRLLGPFPAFYLAINLAFVLGAVWYWIQGKGSAGSAGFRDALLNKSGFREALLMTMTFFAVNAAFCIFATPNMFRYQVAPMIWLFVFTLLTYDRLFSRWIPGPAARKG
ncbi:glycosyltransferase family 39 protein [Flavitalea sp. BT771]|uniref:glycosyltransferase family 39 protein n=1 Tax=Flavitalea sp. BT771 TaxID=3063329 RepID=UPI0026E46CBB|nr:glycosyltransferase family 39 protein [Flavitalea sp. BT771]MDO6435228.1 glycosyltransferase family 39 protein [Flavitalea sp. BT771]MDV6224067.1 glycosyltransferase family 39 protein [Flavitalea sp. BT771]